MLGSEYNTYVTTTNYNSYRLCVVIADSHLLPAVFGLSAWLCGLDALDLASDGAAPWERAVLGLYACDCGLNALERDRLLVPPCCELDPVLPLPEGAPPEPLEPPCCPPEPELPLPV